MTNVAQLGRRMATSRVAGLLAKGVQRAGGLGLSRRGRRAHVTRVLAKGCLVRSASAYSCDFRCGLSAHGARSHAEPRAIEPAVVRRHCAGPLRGGASQCIASQSVADGRTAFAASDDSGAVWVSNSTVNGRVEIQ